MNLYGLLDRNLLIIFNIKLIQSLFCESILLLFLSGNLNIFNTLIWFNSLKLKILKVNFGFIKEESLKLEFDDKITTIN